MKTILDVLRNLKLTEAEEEIANKEEEILSEEASETESDKAEKEIKLTKHLDYPDKVIGTFIGLASTHSFGTTNLIPVFKITAANNLPYPFIMRRVQLGANERLLFLKEDDAVKYKNEFNITQYPINGRDILEAVRIDINGDIPCYANVNIIKEYLNRDPNSIHPIIKKRLESKAVDNPFSNISGTQINDNKEKFINELKKLGAAWNDYEYEIPAGSIYDNSLNCPNVDLLLKNIKVGVRVGNKSAAVDIISDVIDNTSKFILPIKLSQKARTNLKKVIDISHRNTFEVRMQIAYKLMKEVNKKLNINIDRLEILNSLKIYTTGSTFFIRSDVDDAVEFISPAIYCQVSSRTSKSISIQSDTSWKENSLKDLFNKILKKRLLSVQPENIKEFVNNINDVLENKIDDIINSVNKITYIKVSEIEEE